VFPDVHKAAQIFLLPGLLRVLTGVVEMDVTCNAEERKTLDEREV